MRATQDRLRGLLDAVVGLASDLALAAPITDTVAAVLGRPAIGLATFIAKHAMCWQRPTTP